MNYSIQQIGDRIIEGVQQVSGSVQQVSGSVQQVSDCIKYVSDGVRQIKKINTVDRMCMSEEPSCMLGHNS